MIYTKEVELMCPVAKGAKHEPAPIPEEGKWVHAKKIEDISGFTHGVGWCATATKKGVQTYQEMEANLRRKAPDNDTVNI